MSPGDYGGTLMEVFVCPDCGRESHNPNDLLAGWCGACNDWTATGSFKVELHHEPGGLDWYLMRGRECTVALAPRARYCDRGRWLATLDVWGELALSIDSADGWPRYYFDKARALAEIRAWLEARKQL